MQNHQNENLWTCPFGGLVPGSAQAEKSIKFGQIGLCALDGIFKRAGPRIFILVISHAKSTIDIVGSFCLLRLSLQ